MKTPSFYESPRLKIDASRICPGAELVRWLCEQRHLSYFLDEKPEFGLKVPGEPTLRLPGRTASGLLNCLELLNSRCRESESFFRRAKIGDDPHYQWVRSLYSQLYRPVMQLWYGAALGDEAYLRSTLGEIIPRSFKSLRQAKLLIKEGFELDETSLSIISAQVKARLSQLMEELAESSRPFFHAAVPGIRDISLAVFVSPLLLRADYGEYLPPVSQLPRGLQDVIEQLGSTPIEEYVRRVYQYRPIGQPKQEPAIEGPTYREKVRLIKTIVLSRVGVKFLPRFQLFGKLYVSDWKHVSAVLDNDCAFLIAPVNQRQIEETSDPFMLGMDRSPAMMTQRTEIYRALSKVDTCSWRRILQVETRILLRDSLQNGGVLDVLNGYARIVAARTSAAIFGISGPTEQDLLRVVRAIFQHTFITRGADQTARRLAIEAGRELADWMRTERLARLDYSKQTDDVFGRLLKATNSYETGDADGMMAGLLVGSIDTVASNVANIVDQMLKRPYLMQQMRKDRNDPPRLRGWCWEALRMTTYAPLLREAGENACLLGKPVTAGTLVTVLRGGASHDPAAFPHPRLLNPTRPTDRYLHFGRGIHQCSGRDICSVQIPELIRELLEYDISGNSKLRTRGLVPDQLLIQLRLKK